jgi:hypothetical protein
MSIFHTIKYQEIGIQETPRERNSISGVFDCITVSLSTAATQNQRVPLFENTWDPK